METVSNIKTNGDRNSIDVDVNVHVCGFEIDDAVDAFRRRKDARGVQRQRNVIPWRRFVDAFHRHYNAKIVKRRLTV